MPLPATDTFTDTDGVQIANHGTGWTLLNGGDIQGDLDIQSNSLASDAASQNGIAFWDNDAFNADHYSKATIVAITSASVYIGVTTRCSSPSSTWLFNVHSGNSYIDEWVNGTYTGLASSTDTIVVNDVIRMEAEGTTVRCKVNDVEIMSVTDTSLTTGAAGVGGHSDGATTRLDNWEGGNLGVVAGKSRQINIIQTQLPIRQLRI